MTSIQTSDLDLQDSIQELKLFQSIILNGKKLYQLEGTVSM